LSGDLGGGQYRINLNAKGSGLIGWLAGASGEGWSMGSASGSRVIPTSHGLSFRNSKGEFNLRMTLAGGNISKIMIDPPLIPRDDRVPVQEAHMRNVVDPVGALVFLQAMRGSTSQMFETKCFVFGWFAAWTAIASLSWLIAMSGGRPNASSIPDEAPPPPAKRSMINFSWIPRSGSLG
jgi:hypothetical protein